jgi:N-acetyl-gamma-glutamyl-phosphate reductase
MRCRASRKAPTLAPSSKKHYQGQKHFHVMECDDVTRIEPESLNGTNDIEIHVFANEALRQALIVARFDNLGKGASGAAVQNMMLTLGR